MNTHEVVTPRKLPIKVNWGNMTLSVAILNHPLAIISQPRNTPVHSHIQRLFYTQLLAPHSVPLQIRSSSPRPALLLRRVHFFHNLFLLLSSSLRALFQFGPLHHGLTSRNPSRASTGHNSSWPDFCQRQHDHGDQKVHWSRRRRMDTVQVSNSTNSKVTLSNVYLATVHPTTP